LATLHTAFDWDPIPVLAGVFLPVLLLALQRSFKYLAYTSILGDVAVVVGVVGTIWVGLSDGNTMKWPEIDAINTDWESGDLLQGCATISFLYLVHMVTLPLSQSLQHDEDSTECPGKWRSVVTVSYSFITILNLAFALCCVALFSDAPLVNGLHIQNPVTSNLQNGVGPKVIQVLLCLDLLFTIPMVLAVGREIIEGSMLRACSDRNEEFVIQCTRFMLVLVIMVLAYGAVKSSGVNKAFGDVLQLIGGLANTSLALIIPPVAYYKASGLETTMSKPSGMLWNLLSIAISVVGVSLLVSSTFYTMKNVIAPSDLHTNITITNHTLNIISNAANT